VTESDRVLIFDVDGGRASSMANALAALGFPASHCADPAGVSAAFDRTPASAAIVVEPGDVEVFPGVKAEARSRGIPALVVVSLSDEPRSLLRRVEGYDDWSFAPAAGPDLATRLLRLIGAHAKTASAPVINPRFLALAVHDLRTPLNVIGLTIRAIGQSVPVKNPEFDEDLTFLHENARQIEKMLAQLGDFCRLVENASPPSGVEFDLCRFLGDFLEDRAGRPGADCLPDATEQGRPRVIIDRAAVVGIDEAEVPQLATLVDVGYAR